MPRMRRLIALILMLIVPLQYAWSAVVELHGHPVSAPVSMSTHAHDHDFHGSGHTDHDLSVSGDQDGYNTDDHHGSHCHHVLSLALLGDVPLLAHDVSGGRLISLSRAFHSRTPPPLDRPPSARA